MSARTLGYLQVAAAAVLWGSLPIGGRFAFAGGVTPYATAAWRGFFAFVVLLGYTAIRDPRQLRIERRHLGVFVTWGVVAVAAFFVLYMEAVARTSVATAAVLLYTAPAFVAALSTVALREPMTSRKAASIALAFAGAVLVARGYDPAALRLNAAGVLAGLGAGFTYALYSIFAKVAVARYTPTASLTYALGIGSSVLMVVGLPSGWVGAAYAPSAWLALAYLALVTTVLASSLFASGLRHVEASRASVVATVEPVVAAVLAYAILGETLEPLQIVGGAMVLAGAAWVQMERAARRRTA